MFRPRVSRSLAAATISAALVIGVMAGTTSAKKPAPTTPPAPTPTATPTPSPVPSPSGSRKVYFGDVDTEPSSFGIIHLSPFTAGNTFTFDVIARNVGTQTLTQGVLGLGTGAELKAGAGPSLPTGSTIVGATVTSSTGASCPFTAGPGFSCMVGNLPAGAWVQATFAVQTTDAAVGATGAYASFKVAENVSDQGANANTFFASASVTVLPTSSDANATYRLGGLFRLSTDLDPPASDKQTTTIQVPGDTGAGLISILESDEAGTCQGKPCIGQLVRVNVRGGDPQVPYVLWTLVINEIAANPSQGGVIHFDDDGLVRAVIPNSNASACSGSAAVDCLEGYSVNKKNGTTTIVFRTRTNGAARGY
ncbi:MAG TPA: hypothetical protein VLA44_11975 [Clostridia bacterium]|nr:hypothetical protein [Clostridia bacterium]